MKMCYFCEEGQETTCELAKTLFKLGSAYLDYKVSKEQDLVSYACKTLHVECIILLDAFVQLHYPPHIKDKQAQYRDVLWVYWNNGRKEVCMSHEVGNGFGILFQEDGTWTIHE